MTPAWIAELTTDERRDMDNGVLLGVRHRIGELISKYHAVIEHQEKQPGSPTRERLLEGLAAQVELLDEEREQIRQRQREWHEYRNAQRGAGQ